MMVDSSWVGAVVVVGDVGAAAGVRCGTRGERRWWRVCRQLRTKRCEVL